jgi:hypothetical protein
MALLLGSTTSLLAHTSPTSLSVKPKALTGRHENYCDTLRCGNACFWAFETSDCDPFQGLGGVVLEDTSGSLLQLNASWIHSLWYLPPSTTNVTDCPYIQFSFFNSINQSVGWTFIAPGQNHSSCVEFSTEIASYSGVTMFVGVPEDLLEQEDIWGDGNLEEG